MQTSKTEMFKKIAVYCLLAMLGAYVPAQAQVNPWQQLQEICKVYDKATVMSFQAHMKMYAAKKPSFVQSTLEVSAMLSKERSYSKTGPVEMIRDRQYQLMVDHEDKMILLTGARSKAQEGQPAPVFDMKQFLEQMQQSGARIQQVMRGNDTWLELTDLAAPGVQQCNIMYDTHTFLIRRVWMKVDGAMAGVSETSVVDISYDHYQFTEPSAETFATAKFVRINGNQVVLQEKYKNYSLINQL